MIPEEIYDKIIRHAVKAPSQLNTQPWKFVIEPGVIHLLPDFTRSLHMVDPCKINLYISLGCALENLLLTSRHLGYEAIPEIRKSPLQTMVSISLKEGGKPDSPVLFDQIGHRQVVRSTFAPVSISELLIEKTALASSRENISIHPQMQREFRSQLLPIIGKGIQIMSNQRSYVKEKVHWIRFSEKEAMLRGDGIRSSSLGLPFSGTKLSRLIINNQFSANNELKRWSRLIRQSSGFVLFSARENQVDQWIRLGTALQSFVLNLSHAGIQYAPIPLPLDYTLIQKQLAELFEAPENVPLQLIRIGRGKPMPYSFRRNIEGIVNRNLNQ